MFNDLTTLTSYFSTRRSGRPAEMIAPGPDDDVMQKIMEMAMRTPDHGKLAPWRFINITEKRRDEFRNLLARAFLSSHPNASESQIIAASKMAEMAPSLVVMIYSPKISKIPEYEQMLSTGAAGMNLLHGAHIHGFVGSWITGWPAYDEIVRQEFCADNEKIAGFFFFGTAGEDLLERERPEIKAHIANW